MATKWSDFDKYMIESIISEKDDGKYQKLLDSNSTNMAKARTWIAIKDEFCDENNRNRESVTVPQVRDMWKKYNFEKESRN